MERCTAEPRRHSLPHAWWLLGATGLAGVAVAATLLFHPAPELLQTAGSDHARGTSTSDSQLTPAALEVVYAGGEIRLAASRAAPSTPFDLGVTSLKTPCWLELAPNARLDVEVAATGTRAALFGPARLSIAADGIPDVDSGELSLAIAPRQKPTVVARLGADALVVHGTELSFSVAAGELKSLLVHAGLVEVRGEPSAASVWVKGGEAYQPASEGDVVDPLVSQAFSAPWWKRAAEPGPSGHLLVDGRGGPMSVELDHQALGATPLLVRWPAGRYRLSPAGGAFARIVEVRAERVQRIEAPVESGGTPQVRGAANAAAKDDGWRQLRAQSARGECAALDASVAAVLVGAAPGDRARATMLRADCYLLVGDKARALTLYREVARSAGETPSGEAALFESAKLSDELGDAGAALETLDDYLRHHERGALAEDATIRRCQLLLRLSRASEARACLEGYRDDFPSAVKLGEALFLLAGLARAEQRFAEAVDLYRAYLAREPSARQAEEGCFRLVQALIEGKLPGAEDEAARYLARFPNGAHAREIATWYARARLR